MTLKKVLITEDHSKLMELMGSIQIVEKPSTSNYV